MESGQAIFRSVNLIMKIIFFRRIRRRILKQSPFRLDLKSASLSIELPSCRSSEFVETVSSESLSIVQRLIVC